jgi:hypothetical protein
LCIYLLFRFLSYGFATGDSYVWDFTVRKLINTYFWYSLWGFNIPETFLDFVGPGLKINQNLFLYWSKEVVPILSVFSLQTLPFIIISLRIFKSSVYRKNVISTLIFGILWFVISLLPVAFLPLHKFAFYLTLPLIGLVLVIARFLTSVKYNKYMAFLFIAAWTILSVLTLNHTVNTHWITQGESISRRVLLFFNNHPEVRLSKKIDFVDADSDKSLPWSPTTVIKVALSDKNFFVVYFPELADKIEYNGKSETQINSRRFLGY